MIELGAMGAARGQEGPGAGAGAGERGLLYSAALGGKGGGWVSGSGRGAHAPLRFSRSWLEFSASVLSSAFFLVVVVILSVRCALCVRS